MLRRYSDVHRFSIAFDGPYRDSNDGTSFRKDFSWTNIHDLPEPTPVGQDQISHPNVLDRLVPLSGVNKDPRADEALDDIGDIHLVAAPSDRLEHPGQKLTCPPHEGLALDVLLGARGLADAHQIGIRVPRAEDDGGAALRELAAGAAVDFLLKLSERVGRSREIVPGEG